MVWVIFTVFILGPSATIASGSTMSLPVSIISVSTPTTTNLSNSPTCMYELYPIMYASLIKCFYTANSIGVIIGVVTSGISIIFILTFIVIVSMICFYRTPRHKSGKVEVFLFCSA